MAGPMTPSWSVTPAGTSRRPSALAFPLAVRTGGFGADELRDAGASEVFESVDELRQALPHTPLG